MRAITFLTCTKWHGIYAPAESSVYYLWRASLKRIIIRVFAYSNARVRPVGTGTADSRYVKHREAQCVEESKNSGDAHVYPSRYTVLLNPPVRDTGVGNRSRDAFGTTRIYTVRVLFASVDRARTRTHVESLTTVTDVAPSSRLVVSKRDEGGKKINPLFPERKSVSQVVYRLLFIDWKADAEKSGQRQSWSRACARVYVCVRARACVRGETL
jgi:hypothetical protein